MTKDEKIFSPEQLLYKPKKIQPCTAKQIEYLKALCEMHELKFKGDFCEMTRSEASKLIDKIISEHGR